MANIISFEDFSKKSKSVSEDTILPTGNSTVFVSPEGETHSHNHHEDHEGHEKNYMFFKNLYAMKKCIEEIMAKDDIQEVFDWIRYEIDNYEEDGEEGEVDLDDVTVDVEGDDDDAEIEDGDDDDDEEDDEDDDEEEEEEEASESKGPKYSYKEEKK